MSSHESHLYYGILLVDRHPNSYNFRELMESLFEMPNKLRILEAKFIVLCKVIFKHSFNVCEWELGK